MYVRLSFLLATSLAALSCVAQPITPESHRSGLNHAKVTSAHAQAQHKAAAKPESVKKDNKELEQLKQLILDQHAEEQRQLDLLQNENQQLREQLKGTETKLSTAEKQLDQLVSDNDAQVGKLQAEVAAVKTSQTATSEELQLEKKTLQEWKNPLALKYRGVNIALGGYFSGDVLYRNHAENADINTSWASIPYDAQTMSHLSEFRASSRQTRLSLRADGSLRNAAMTTYFETDFLGSGFGASEVQSNGYSNRIRQMWGRVQFPNGWTFASGQMWSLITTNRVGIENLAEMNPAIIDSSTFLGFDYARQTAFRVTKRFNSAYTAAFSAENAATVGVTPANVPSSVTSLISGLSTTGTGALSNTTYSTNAAPDLIAKVAFDPGFGHYEIKAIGRTFRDRLNSSTTTSGKNNTLLAGAIGGAASFPVFTPKVSFMAHGMWGGIGRYGATSTDVVVKPNGELSTEKSVHALTGLETHPTSRLDWYLYASDEYLPRNYGYGLASIDNSKCFLEAGFSCSASLRNLEGGVTGIWYRFYKGPAGSLQYGLSYLHVIKNTWHGVGGAPRGIENMFETSIRYYLPQ